MLDKVKKYLRISHNELDDEVTDLINACKKDLEISGVASSSIDEVDPLIKRAIITYCKAHFGYNNPDYERLIKSYDLLKGHLALSYEEDDENVA